MPWVAAGMDKRSQVFVSSTFTDLQLERHHAIQALLAMDCFPAGMELFPASDDDQWTLIKRVIDECDYYILILAGRYGSTSPDGIGYTEKEYDYAVSVKKPVMGFLHVNPGSLPFDKSEQDPKLREKLEAFRAKVKQRMCQFWASPEDLETKISTSLPKLIKSHPAEGWVKAGIANPYDELQVLGIGDRAVNSFRKGGNASNLEGKWEAKWMAFDESGVQKPYIVKKPDDHANEIEYPSEVIKIRSSGSTVFCTAEKPSELGQETTYWLAGRLSYNNELTLMYWNEKNYMTGSVFLRFVQEFGQPEVLTGWWCGHSMNHKLIHGPTEWVKKRRVANRRRHALRPAQGD